ncbi:hypothetical protein PC116_g24823 [Phytophthora cactorum]|nr:hypothetical protein PC116_g24823 [Phytophthora cactorum]
MEDLFDLLPRVATSPGVLSNAEGILSGARSGNTAPVSPMIPPTMPVVITHATPMIPMAPIYASAAPVAALPSTSA